MSIEIEGESMNLPSAYFLDIESPGGRENVLEKSRDPTHILFANSEIMTQPSLACSRKNSVCGVNSEVQRLADAL